MTKPSRQLPPKLIAYGEHFSADGDVSEREEANRDAVDERFDLLLPQFLYAMALNMGEGAKRYGDFNYLKGQPGHKSPINHALKHINLYQQTGDIDHLIHAACNLMIRYHQETNDGNKPKR